jgi:putative PIN family toxin of toxin-antitoxin system
MKVFLDTNVLVSALATRGLCGDVVREVLLSHQLIISLPLLTEVEKALRGKLGAPPTFISEFIQVLKQDALLSSPTVQPEVLLKDKDDLIILSSALSGDTDLFVTGDKEVLDLRKIGKMQIVSPRGFWEKLKESKDLS